ncbi:hypothetical protein LF1_31440 [Rubripirellula obstinata]|uniref:Uncharacterized protein n=1 Tax=Rubripirellula obstinata TaxID=406547 RepID=A0A5B1CMV6_9BACT|nr:hypothetical protein [Rubripirellula obstinata]KAA1260604.1 hypothetical protein LF1_31440 [Rubripirellula obstinata]
MKRFQTSPLVLLGILGIASIQVVGVGQNPDYQNPAQNQGFEPSSDPNLAGLPAWAGQVDQTAQAANLNPPASGVSAPNVGAAGDIIGFSHSDGAGSQRITLVNTSKSWMAVYHIDRSGKIRLASSRPIDADFTLQLNATAPLPDEIRRMDRR